MNQLLHQIYSFWLALLAFWSSFLRSSAIHFDSSKLSVVLDAGSAGGSTSLAASDAKSSRSNNNSSSATLGEGAYATVYRARDKFDPNKHYAVKKMYLQSPELERSYQQEVSSFQRFRHANILRLIDSQVRVAEDQQKIAFMLFPLMRRGTLRDELNRTILSTNSSTNTNTNTGLRDGRALTKILSDFLAVCSALNVLHTHEPAYVHQDIKPENILIDDSGTPLVTDFGSVRLAEVDITNRAQSLAIADEAASMCTVSYRAPELFDPPKGSRLDTRSDVWALGCLLFAWWHGYSPFECEFTDAAAGAAGGVGGVGSAGGGQGAAGYGSANGSGNTNTSGSGNSSSSSGIINYSARVRVVECGYSRVLSKMPRLPPGKASPQDATVQALSEWILDRDFSVRPFTSDVMARLRDVLVDADDKA